MKKLIEERARRKWDDEEKKTSQNGEMGMEGTVDEGKRKEMGKNAGNHEGGEL